MAERDGDSSKRDLLIELVKLLRTDEALRQAIGKRTTQFLLATLVVALAESTYGLPIVTLATSPFVGAIVVFLLDSVEAWIRSGRPAYVFFACSNPWCTSPQRFFAIPWQEVPKHRKRKSCSDCGSKLVKRCHRGKHYIVSPSTESSGSLPPPAPTADTKCPFCDPSTPYLPA
jgi:hypothetical protein